MGDFTPAIFVTQKTLHTTLRHYLTLTGNTLKIVTRGQYVIVMLGKFRETGRLFDPERMPSLRVSLTWYFFELFLIVVQLMVVQNEYEYG